MASIMLMLMSMLMIMQLMRGVYLGGFEAAKAGLESGELDGSNLKCLTRYSGWYAYLAVVSAWHCNYNSRLGRICFSRIVR